MSDIVDQVEQFASRFVPKAKALTARLASSRRWVEIEPSRPNAVAFRKEILTIDPEFARMLQDLVNLANDCASYILETQTFESPAGSADERIAAAVTEMIAAVKDYAQQRERDTTLPEWVTNCGVLRQSLIPPQRVGTVQAPQNNDNDQGTGTDGEFLIGSRRFQ